MVFIEAKTYPKLLKEMAKEEVALQKRYDDEKMEYESGAKVEPFHPRAKQIVVWMFIFHSFHKHPVLNDVEKEILDHSVWKNYLESLEQREAEIEFQTTVNQINALQEKLHGITEKNPKLAKKAKKRMKRSIKKSLPKIDPDMVTAPLRKLQK